MKRKLDAVPLITQLPLGHGRDFKGIIDLLPMDVLVWNSAQDGSSFSRVPLVKCTKGPGGGKDYRSVHTLLGSELKFADLPVGRDDIKTALDHRSSLAEQVHTYIYLSQRRLCCQVVQCDNSWDIYGCPKFKF